MKSKSFFWKKRKTAHKAATFGFAKHQLWNAAIYHKFFQHKRNRSQRHLKCPNTRCVIKFTLGGRSGPGVMTLRKKLQRCLHDSSSFDKASTKFSTLTLWAEQQGEALCVQLASYVCLTHVRLDAGCLPAARATVWPPPWRWVAPLITAARPATCPAPATPLEAPLTGGRSQCPSSKRPTDAIISVQCAV